MAIDLRALVLPAFEDLDGLPSEAAPWRRAYDLGETVSVSGVEAPLWYGESGLGVVPTGLGKVAAAATTTALCADERVSLSDALVCSVGVAGGPPALPVGSVVLADRIVDWDDKCRFDPGTDDPLALNPYTGESGVFEVDADRLSRAESLAAGVDLEGVGDGGPAVVTGTNLCGDELWHGRDLAAQASWLAAERGGRYRVTEMEDIGTATVLKRFGHADRYLSVRGISNHDRPTDGESARESFFAPEFEAGFEVGLGNAVRVARALVDDRLE